MLDVVRYFPVLTAGVSLLCSFPCCLFLCLVAAIVPVKPSICLRRGPEDGEHSLQHSDQGGPALEVLLLATDRPLNRALAGAYPHLARGSIPCIAPFRAPY